jgi:hypothetical protein
MKWCAPTHPLTLLGRWRMRWFFMASPVASGAERNQVFLGIIPQRTSRLNVVNLKVRSSTAVLATPSISL